MHGGIDGYSRLVVFLKASANNKPATMLASFVEGVDHYGLPSRVRCDKGGENVPIHVRASTTRAWKRKLYNRTKCP